MFPKRKGRREKRMFRSLHGHGVAYIPSPVIIILVLAHHIRQLLFDKWFARNGRRGGCIAHRIYLSKKKADSCGWKTSNVTRKFNRRMSHRMRFVCERSEQLSVDFPLGKCHYLFILSAKACWTKKKSSFWKTIDILGHTHTHVSD